MERREKLLAGIDVRTSPGLEIGPLTSPIVTKAEGPIVYVDHADSASLRVKYANDPKVDVASIVDVDGVWGQEALREILGENHKVDYILASHVIEHVPDLITWLEELRSVLNAGGTVRLAVPDRRFTFDYLRRETTLTDIIYAYLMHPRTPLPYSILDFMLNLTKVDCIEAWRGTLDKAALKPAVTMDDAMSVAKHAFETGTYHDVHCWVFTPKSFAALFEQAAELGLINFMCEAFFDTEPDELEFVVQLRECSDRRKSAESWRRMKEAAWEVKPHEEDPLLSDARKEIIRLHQETGRLKHQLITEERALTALTERLMDVERETAATREQQSAALRTSFEECWNARSWQLFSPIRNMLHRFRGMGREEKPAIYSAEEAEQRIRAIRESTSWELLGPLRALNRIRRRLSSKPTTTSPKVSDSEGRAQGGPQRSNLASGERPERRVGSPSL